VSWIKALIIGFCVYGIINILGFVIFVALGLGYTYPSIANKFAAILAFPLGTGKNYNFFLSGFFWIVLISVILKIVSSFSKIK
jgi:hypothetical protein